MIMVSCGNLGTERTFAYRKIYELVKYVCTALVVAIYLTVLP
jgi:hypothetical protein